MKQTRILDLTDKNWKKESKWQYVGLTIVNRAYKRSTVYLASLIFLSGFPLFFIPFWNPGTSAWAAIKLLGWKG